MHNPSEAKHSATALAEQNEGIGVRSANVVAMSKHEARSPYQTRVSLVRLHLANEGEGNKSVKY